MPTTELPTTPALTVADLLCNLGDISPARVCLHPPIGTATAADVLVAGSGLDKRLCELIDGTLIEKAMGFRESVLTASLSAILGRFVNDHGLGVVIGGNGPIQLSPGHVRLPDLAYFAWDRLPGRRIPAEPIPPIAPSLNIAVLRAENTVREMQRKRREYFGAGTDEMWEISLTARSVMQYRAGTEISTYLEADAISTHLLPGFQLSVRELFAVLDEHG